MCIARIKNRIKIRLQTNKQTNNKLSLKVAKTKAIVILTKQKEKQLADNDDVLSLNIEEQLIDSVQIAKYLGIQIDNNLNWKDHIKTLSTKIRRAIGFLKHAKSFLTQDTLKTLYIGNVKSHFRYCCSDWGNFGTTEKNHLQELQNRAASILRNSFLMLMLGHC